MSDTPLCYMAFKYGTDKGYPHQYTPIYHKYLAPIADEVHSVLEIGICVTRALPNGRTGASLFMWEEFFPNAEIFGVDIDPASMINEGRIRSALADQGNSGMMNAAVAEFGGGPFDVIIDDGTHDPTYQVAAAIIMLPHLEATGHYFIEDIYVDPAVIEGAIRRAMPTDKLTFEVFEGGKPLPEGYGRRDWGGPPAGECLMLIRKL